MFRLKFNEQLNPDQTKTQLERHESKNQDKTIYVVIVAKAVFSETFTGFEDKKSLVVKGDLCTEVFSDEEDQIKLN